MAPYISDRYPVEVANSSGLSPRPHSPQWILPGIDHASREPICTDCAGFSTGYRCARYNREDKLHGGRLCTRCTFSDRLTELLDDGTGRIRPELLRFAEHMLAMNSPGGQSSGVADSCSPVDELASPSTPTLSAASSGTSALPTSRPEPPPCASGRRITGSRNPVIEGCYLDV